MATKKQGGKRANAGRKEVKDKKEPVFIYVRKSIIKKYGGKANVKEAAETYLGC